MPDKKGSLRVAAGQIDVGDDIDQNLERILAAMTECADRSCRIVVLPETALTGYAPAIGVGRQPSEWPQIAGGLEAIAAQARDLGLWTVVGSEAWNRGVWWNRLYAFSDTGDLVATYDKVHLMSVERPYYRPGSQPVLLEMCGLRVGLQICYDVRFPEGYRTLLHQGVELVLQGFYGAGGAIWKVPVLNAHVVSRAAESGCFVVAANVSGPQQIVQSAIVDPLGLVLAQADLDQRQIIIADIDVARIGDSEIRRDYLERHADTA